MVKYINLFILFILLSSCSFKNTGFYKDKLKELEDEIAKKNSKLVFSERKVFNKEIDGLLKKKLKPPIQNKNWTQKNLSTSNYVPHLKYDNEGTLLYKSKKLGKNKFRASDIFFEPIISNNNIFFYDKSGTIYKFSLDKLKLLWKFNFYKKRFTKIPIKVNLKINGDNLIVSDSLGYIYSLISDTGKLKWAKNYGIPFQSNLKIDSGKVLLLNQDNKFYSIFENNGDLDTSLETFPSFLKSEKETNIVLDKDNNTSYFLTSGGQLYSIDYLTKNLKWIKTLIVGSSGQGAGIFFSSPMVLSNNKIFFSSSISTFSINKTNGLINWELPFGTNIRPVVTENYIFLASKNGFFLSVNAKTGNVIWSKNLFNNKKIKIKKTGNIVSLFLISNKIMATTSKGYFLFLDYRNGEVSSYTKAASAGFFSRPSIVDGKIYLIDSKMRLLIYQ